MLQTHKIDNCFCPTCNISQVAEVSFCMAFFRTRSSGIGISTVCVVSVLLLVGEQTSCRGYGRDVTWEVRIETNWLVVEPPIWKIWKWLGMIIPYIWENKGHVPNHQPTNTSMAISEAIDWRYYHTEGRYVSAYRREHLHVRNSHFIHVPSLMSMSQLLLAMYSKQLKDQTIHSRLGMNMNHGQLRPMDRTWVDFMACEPAKDQNVHTCWWLTSSILCFNHDHGVWLAFGIYLYVYIHNIYIYTYIIYTYIYIFIICIYIYTYMLYI